MSLLRKFVCKALTEEVWSSLRQAKIITVTDFIVRDREEIAQTCGIDYKDVVSIGRVLLAQHSSFPVTAAQLYDNVVSSQAIYPTGISSLDELLEGGFYSGDMYELTGEVATGKTQVCLWSAVTVARLLAQQVLFIDTCGSFCSQAAARFIPGSGTQQACSPEMEESVLNRISCVLAADVYCLFAVLDDLRSSLKTKMHVPFSCVRLVVIDCMTTVFSPLQGGKQTDCLALMEQLGRQLKSLALEYNLAVVVTNNVTRGMDGDVLPSLGRLWSHVPHTRILLEKLPSCSLNSSLRKATILKSVRMAMSSTTQIDLEPQV